VQHQLQLRHDDNDWNVPVYVESGIERGIELWRVQLREVGFELRWELAAGEDERVWK
jgi:hypothetical protein